MSQTESGNHALLKLNPTPLRITLRRKKGWRLQEFSQQLNGLAAVNCARPSKWGNRHRVGFCLICGYKHDQAGAVAAHQLDLGSEQIALIRKELRGKNLACFCKPSEPCHCDNYLEIANA